MSLPLGPEMLLALAGFSFVSSVTPGPNNLMLLASGVNYGFVRTIPHMLGIGIGFAVLLLCTGFGLGQLFERVPSAYLVLQIAGAAYLLYLAWRIANAAPPEPRGTGEGAAGQADSGRPMWFIEAAAFQWVNPKAWVMAVTSMSIYTNPQAHTASVLTIAAMFTLINVPTVSLWCGMGTALREFLSDPAKLRLFNWTMAGLLVLSLWPMLA